MNKNQKIVIGILIGVIVLLLGVVTVSVKANNTSCVVDLPEELQAITEDSLHAVPLYGWRDSNGKLRVEMRNYKPEGKLVLCKE